MSGPRGMSSRICSNCLYFEESSKLHGSRWPCCKSQTRNWLGTSPRPKPLPLDLPWNMEEHKGVRVTCWISGVTRDVTWHSDGSKACSAGLLAVASDGTGSIVAEWGKVGWAASPSGRWWLPTPNSCRSEWPILEESRLPSSYLAGFMNGWAAGRMVAYLVAPVSEDFLQTLQTQQSTGWANAAEKCQFPSCNGSVDTNLTGWCLLRRSPTLWWRSQQLCCNAEGVHCLSFRSIPIEQCSKACCLVIIGA